jgi:hypothetical protein
MNAPEVIPDQRGDAFATPPCQGCEEHREHIEQLEDALAAARASMILLRSRLKSMMETLSFAGWGSA